MKLLEYYSKKDYQLKDYNNCKMYKVIEMFAPKCEKDYKITYEVHPDDYSFNVGYCKTLKEARQWAKEYWASKH
jgi:hypothetical protein